MFLINNKNPMYKMDSFGIELSVLSYGNHFLQNQKFHHFIIFVLFEPIFWSDGDVLLLDRMFATVNIRRLQTQNVGIGKRGDC